MTAKIKTRAFTIAKLALAIALIACISSPAVATAGAATVKPLPTESLQEYEGQLAGGQVKATAFNTKVRSIHVTLASGKIVLVHYPAHSEKGLLEAVKAKGITPTSLKTGKALTVPKGTKHKLRYIVGGAVIVVLILIGVALLVVRRRRAAAEY
jgi:hypothetical protein